MLTDLAAAIDALHVPATVDDLVQGFTLVDRLHAHLVEAAHRFNADGKWADDGAYSMKNWMHTHLRVDKHHAGRLLATGRKLASLPVTTRAAKDGDLSADHVAAITTNVTAATVEAYAEVEAELTPVLASMTPSEVHTAMRYWKQTTTDAEPPASGDHGVFLSQHFGGKWALNGDLTPDAGRVVDQALTAATVDTPEDRTQSQRRADALVNLARFYLANTGSNTPITTTPAMVIIPTIDDLTSHEPHAGFSLTGQPLTRQDLSRIACDCTVHRLLVAANGAILDIGRRTRVINPALRLAVATRDRHCRFPGCDRPVSECEVHHIVAWSRGGRTALDNLALACFAHHDVFHRPDWTITGDANSLRITTPAGVTHTSRPPPHNPLGQHRTRRSAWPQAG